MFFEKAFFKNFAIFTGKHLCWSLLKSLCLEAFRAARLLKRDSKTGVFLEYSKIFKSNYFEEHQRTTASELDGSFATTTFKETIFQNSLYNIFSSNFYFAFVSLNMFISLNNFITYSDSHE